MPVKLLLATRNPGKAREFAALLRDGEIELLDLRDLPNAAPATPETEDTYWGNAFLKANEVARWSSLPSLADDSGLEVDALGGAPGVHSAYFAGPHATDADNIRKLLEELRGVPLERRTARFRCVLVVVRPDGQHLSAEGTCEGIILEEPRGKAGFGYDPVFFYPPLGKTFAELSFEEKNRVSHRARAAVFLKPKLLPFLREA